MYDYRLTIEELASGDQVMTIIFSVSTYIAMGLCLFSLIASMYTNIYEQSKEIAVLRALGLTAVQLEKVYVYEAFTLTAAASVMGTCIGVMVGFTMTLQRTLFTQLPISFEFPYDLMLQTLAIALVCALISSYLPARALMRKTVSAVMRTVL